MIGACGAFSANPHFSCLFKHKKQNCSFPDGHRRAYVQRRSLKVVEHLVPGLRAPSNHEYLGSYHQSGDQGYHNRGPTRMPLYL